MFNSIIALQLYLIIPEWKVNASRWLQMIYSVMIPEEPDVYNDRTCYNLLTSILEYFLFFHYYLKLFSVYFIITGY